MSRKADASRGLCQPWINSSTRLRIISRQAQNQISVARKALDEDAKAAKAGLQQQAESLAAEVIRAVLKSGTAQSQPAWRS